MRSKLSFLIPLGILFFGIAITTLLIVDSKQSDDKISFDSFISIANEYTRNIESDMIQNLNIMISLSLLFNINPDTSREKFKTYITPQLEDTSIQAVGYIPQVTNYTFRLELEKEAQVFYQDPSIVMTGITDDGLQTSPNKSVHYPVYYIEPVETNKAALMFDLGSNPQRLDAINRSLKNRKISETDIISLVQDEYVQPGILMALPIGNTSNLITAVYRINPMLQKILNRNNPRKMHIDFFQEEEVITSFKYSSDTRWNHLPIGSVLEENENMIVRHIDVADRKWKIVFHDLDENDNDKLILIGIFTPSITLILIIVSLLLIKMANNRMENNLRQNETSLKDKFVSYIFHEIRVPLNAITIGVDNLQNQENISSSNKQTLEIISTSLDQTTHVLNDILDLNKIESGKFTLNKTRFSISQLISEIMNTFQGVMESKNISFQFHMDRSLRKKEVNADRFRVTQCLNNLLSNAAKYTDPGGMVKLSVTKMNDTIRFEVEDTGCGITEEDQENLFRPYVQVKNTRSSEIGTGLGLVIAKQIATLHQGEIGVNSVLGKGSRFWFSISSDLYDQSEVKPNSNDIPLQEITTRVYSKLKFLIVDDNKSSCIVLSDYLKSKGIESDYVFNGMEAVNKIKATLSDQVDEQKYDLIIMDKHMPVMDGIQATQVIRDLKVDIPIIALTGLSDDTQKNELMKAGVNEILIKPLKLKLFDEILKDFFL